MVGLFLLALTLELSAAWLVIPTGLVNNEDVVRMVVTTRPVW